MCVINNSTSYIRKQLQKKLKIDIDLVKRVISTSILSFDNCSMWLNNVFGKFDENVQELIPNNESEMDYKHSCLNNTSCCYYTYFFNNDTLFHKFCLLQKEFLPPIESCETCITGPVSCQEVNRELYQSVMLTSSTKDITVQRSK